MPGLKENKKEDVKVKTRAEVAQDLHTDVNDGISKRLEKLEEKAAIFTRPARSTPARSTVSNTTVNKVPVVNENTHHIASPVVQDAKRYDSSKLGFFAKLAYFFRGWFLRIFSFSASKRHVRGVVYTFLAGSSSLEKLKDVIKINEVEVTRVFMNQPKNLKKGLGDKESATLAGKEEVKGLLLDSAKEQKTAHSKASVGSSPVATNKQHSRVAAKGGQSGNLVKLRLGEEKSANLASSAGAFRQRVRELKNKEKNLANLSMSETVVENKAGQHDRVSSSALKAKASRPEVPVQQPRVRPRATLATLAAKSQAALNNAQSLAANRPGK